MQDGKPVVLYVDDDPDFRHAIRQVLEAGGMIVVEAGNGEEGLRAFRKSKPDLILLDLMMEEVDAGVNVLLELRALGNTAPVYLISSVGSSMDMVTSTADLGFAGVFQKPINKDNLLSVLRSRLG